MPRLGGSPSSIKSHVNFTDKASKQEVYLYTFRLDCCEREEDKVVVHAAMNAFKHAWVEFLVAKDFVGLQRLFRTLEDLIAAMNEYSEDYVFRFHEVDKSDLLASFVEFPLILFANFVKYSLFPEFGGIFEEGDYKGLEMLVKYMDTRKFDVPGQKAFYEDEKHGCDSVEDSEAQSAAAHVLEECDSAFNPANYSTPPQSPRKPPSPGAPRKVRMKRDKVMRFFPREIDEKSIQINVMDTIRGRMRGHLVIRDKTLIRTVLDDHLPKTIKDGLPNSLLWFEYNGTTLFPSSLAKTTPADLGMEEGDTIHISYKPFVLERPRRKAAEGPSSVRRPHPKPKKRRGKLEPRKRASKANARSPAILTPGEQRKRNLRAWMDGLSEVFVEASDLFTKRRQELQALELVRAMPKDRSSSTLALSPMLPVNVPPSDGLGGKVGRTSFLIRVGETSNLYLTTKTRTSVACTLDLHRLSRDQALMMLNDCLPQWMEDAMHRVHPFVITVRLVVGRGNQILADCVEAWIRGQKNVANAPTSSIRL